jgi:hypothetical protein
MDKDNPTRQAKLDSLIRGISESSLVLSSDTLIGDETNEVVFKFKYDSSGGKFGAGTAFLQD